MEDKMEKYFFLWLIFLMINVYAKDEKLSKIYIDKSNNVHIIDLNGKKSKLTKDGKAIRASISEDKSTVAWLKQENWIAEGDKTAGASRLYVYRNRRTRMIECNPFIRDYWFWEGGRQVGIDCGGRHFAGTLSLYDVKTGKELESFFQSDIPEKKRPAWSASGPDYESQRIQ